MILPVNTQTNSLIRLLKQVVFALLFAGLLSLAFLDHSQYLLPWIAFVPLLFAIDKASLGKSYLIGLIAGLVLFASGTYWITDFVTLSKGYNASESLVLAVVYWFYCAHSVALLLVMFQWLKTYTNLHEYLLFPLLVASFSAAFPMIFSMRLGESQINFYSGLQAIEFFGVYSLDALIALVNIVIFRFLNRIFSGKPMKVNASKWPLSISVSIIVIWFSYGVKTYIFWEIEAASWEQLRIGIVQPNEKPSLKNTIRSPGYSLAYPAEMEMTERLSRMGADIIIWPEAHDKGYLDHQQISRAYQQNINKLGSSLLFQDTQHIRNAINGEVHQQYNTAIMLDGHGLEVNRYRKIKRIPFGEYLPLLSDNSAAKRWASNFLGDFLSELSQGEEHKVFSHNKVNIVPLICYETTFPAFVAEAVNQALTFNNKSAGGLLVGLSNDGWFGSRHQSYQHIMSSVLRAVENRLPLVHVVNNGPSIVVNPSGKIIFTSDFQHAGGYRVDVPYSNSLQGSFYSRYPNLFIYIVYIIFILSVLHALKNTIYRHKNKIKQPSSIDMR